MAIAGVGGLDVERLGGLHIEWVGKEVGDLRARRPVRLGIVEVQYTRWQAPGTAVTDAAYLRLRRDVADDQKCAALFTRVAE